MQIRSNLVCSRTFWEITVVLFGTRTQTLLLVLLNEYEHVFKTAIIQINYTLYRYFLNTSSREMITIIATKTGTNEILAQLLKIWDNHVNYFLRNFSKKSCVPVIFNLKDFEQKLSQQC
jgi:hypothetical protein